jgi:drug/metabolite transporter (DMT)-like permease
MDLFFIILVLLSTIAYSIQKKVMTEFTLMEFWIIYSIISFSLAMLALCITKTCTNQEVNIFNKIKKNSGINWIVLSLFAIVILTSVSGICQMKYLQKTDLGVFLSVSKSMAIVLGFLVGMMLNNEKPCITQLAGAGIIIAGVALIGSGIKK